MENSESCTTSWGQMWEVTSKSITWLWQYATKDCTICSGILQLVSQFFIPCKSCDFFMTLHSVCECNMSVPGLKEYPVLQLYIALVFQRVEWFSSCTSLWGNNCGYPHVMAANETESVRMALFWTAEQDTCVVTKNKNTEWSNNKISPLLMFCEILLVMCTIHNLTPSHSRQFIINKIQLQITIFILITWIWVTVHETWIYGHTRVVTTLWSCPCCLRNCRLHWIDILNCLFCITFCLKLNNNTICSLRI
jgi:hypothetical protein